MGSLTKCLKKAGLSQHEAAILKGTIEDYKGEGYDAHKAAVRAVRDHVEDLLDERAGIVAQVAQKGGKAHDAPYSMDEARAATDPR